MILYAVEYFGPLTNYDASIVTIHKSFDKAEAARKQYESNNISNSGRNAKFVIKMIDTDIDRDCIYDYEDTSVIVDDDDYYDECVE